VTDAWFADARAGGHAAVAGSETALLDGPIRWTWADLDGWAEAIAADLSRAGLHRGGVVALLADPSAPAVAGLLAILRAGGIAAPLPGGLTGPELRAVAGVLRPRLVLHDAAAAASAVVMAEAATATGGTGPALIPLSDSAAAGTQEAGGARAPLAADGAARGATDPAVVVLTSGTTGPPRGVLLSAAALAASADAWIAALPPATGWLLALGLGHVAGLGVLWRAIASRVPVRILPANDPAALLAALRAEPPPSHVSLVPAQLVRVLDAAGDAPPPASLRAVLLGGGPIPPRLVERAVRSGWPVVPTYGLSEAGSGVTALLTPDAALHPASAGSPLPGVHVRIDDPDAAAVGEIVVRTPARFSGYLGEDPTGTAVPDADSWLRTGDLGRLDDAGRLTVSDRRTDRIVRGGENVSPAEVEAVLAAHPAIADAGVVARADELFGHVPVAAVVLRDPAADPGDDALARHCRASLAGYKVPAAFVRMASLPRTAGGKLRRQELRDRVATPSPAASSPESPGMRSIRRPDGVRVAWHETGDGPLATLLLHGTLSNGRQLARIASELARAGGLRVLAVDRRGSGASRLADPRPVDVGVHVADLLAILDAEGIRAAALVGISYGGVLTLEFAARHPERVLAAVAWEPPYVPLAPMRVAAGLRDVAVATEAAYRDGGPARAAETFMRGVAGDAAWERLSPRGRAFVEDEGDGALVDVRLSGLDPDALPRIGVPVAVLTGDASEPFYGPIADALVERISTARRTRIAGLGHAAPITDAPIVAAEVRHALVEAGVLSPEPDAARGEHAR